MNAERIQEIVSLYKQLRAYNQALAEQRETALRATAQTLPEDVAAQAPLLYPAWDWQSCKRDMIVNYNGQLYRVLNTPTDNRPPDAEGMLAVYRPIDREHAGTADDPIPWVYGMDCHAGKCYRYNGKVYQVAEGGDMIPCTWPPDTPGMWQWEEVQA